MKPSTMMKALQVNAAWKPRDGYTPTRREVADRRAILGTNIFYDPTLELVEKPIPEPADDEVLLKVGGASVCGSDTLFLGKDEDGYSRYSGHCKFPVTIGHEFSGEIVKIGKHVKQFKVGDLVVAETMNWCGECDACRQGLFNQCENLEEIGFTLDGGYANYLVAKEKFCFDVSELVPVYGSKEKALEVAAMVEPTAVAYNGVFTRGGGIQPGQNAIVFGCGPIGLSAISLLRAAGAAKIFAVEILPLRKELAEKVGADVILDPIELQKSNISIVDKVMELTRNVGVGMAVECTHSPARNIKIMEDMMAIGGTIVQIGISGNTTPVDTVALQKKAVNYHFAIGSSGHGIWQNVIRLIAAGRIDPGKFLSRTYPLEQAVEAIEVSAKGEVGKVVVTPNW